MVALLSLFRPRRGVAVPHRKNTAACTTVTMPPPAEVLIPMSQHLGAPCTPTVAVGDTVYVGQTVGDSDQAFSVPVHCSVSGTVKAIENYPTATGTCQALRIVSDGEQRLFPDLHPPVVETREDFVRAVRAGGLVGLGGAGFPVHIKLNPKNIDRIDTLIINGAECEPYITTDCRECIEHPEDVADGIRALLRFLPVKRVLIAIEANKPEAIASVKQAVRPLSTPECPVQVRVLPTRYPQGAEKVTIEVCTGRRVPAGKLPADVGCVVLNVTSTATLARYLRTGIPLTKKRVTVDGSAIAHPQNVLVPVGTSVGDVIDFTGGCKAPVAKLLLGGPMMGQAQASRHTPLLKQNNAILAFAAEDAKLPEPSNCIRCGQCVRACPMRLLPTSLEAASRMQDVDALRRLNAMTCLECGCCSFTCPAHRPLVQAIRLGKELVRAADKQRR